ncbi:hypothetical protein OHA72_49445 [Dactylosporangium sp. NBC_01737]|uniref:hypothetical protein n=1 Tax=Dactylosporangium sp. NBC_01737 TaxID=2975959 RepID=UPI002E143539|nr:hypothetical protein OHA72_49445 [Dactylosporangium sp. NBC_01737]
MDDRTVVSVGQPHADVWDALKALVGTDMDDTEYAEDAGAFGWLLGEAGGSPAGIGAVLIRATSAVTPTVHREVLVQALEHALAIADELGEQDRRYLAAYRDVAGAVLELLRQRGPVLWRSQAVAQVSATTGLTRAESALMLAGLPIRDWDEDEFLCETQRSVLELTAREAKVGRMELMTVPVAHRVQVLDAAMPDQAAALWEHGLDVGRLCSTWNAVQGRRVPVREELLAELGTVMGFPTDILRTFTSPRPGDWLHNDGECRVDVDTVITRAPAGGEPFSQRHLPSAAGGLAWLAYHLPAGDPIRANLAQVYDLIRLRLRNPSLLIGTVLLRRESVPDVLPPGIVAGQTFPSGLTTYHLRPAFITGPDDPALDVMPDHSPISIRLMLDPAFERMIHTLETGGIPPGAYNQNALLSVTHIVERVAQRFELPLVAASLYLQLLALPDPTDAHLLRWNGWDAAQLAQIASELLRRQLVVEDVRPAGRQYFIPGPWLERKFVPAFEAWKSTLYGFTPNQEPPYRWHLVTRPVTDLFQAAADRVTSGDLPR